MMTKYRIVTNGVEYKVQDKLFPFQWRDSFIRIPDGSKYGRREWARFATEAEARQWMKDRKTEDRIAKAKWTVVKDAAPCPMSKGDV